MQPVFGFSTFSVGGNPRLNSTGADAINRESGKINSGLSGWAAHCLVRLPNVIPIAGVGVASAGTLTLRSVSCDPGNRSRTAIESCAGPGYRNYRSLGIGTE